MDERIEIETKKIGDLYQTVVWVKGEIYAEVRGPDEAGTVAGAQHYAMQIEFDEWGNG